MNMDCKIVDKTSVDYLIKESHMDGSELSILCQEVGKEESRIIQISIKDVRVNYSDVTEPCMNLETLRVIPKSWLHRRLYKLSSGHIAHINVPRNYKGILGNYAESNKST